MTLDLTLLVVMGVLFAGGIHLLLDRSLTRILLGVVLVNNGVVVLLFLTSGDAGLAPLRQEGTDPAAYSDTLPQALILTAIVIGFAVTAFLAAMIYRSWLLLREDEVVKDAEDLKVAGRSAWDAEDDSDLAEEHSEFLTDDADPNADYEHATPASPRARAAGSAGGATAAAAADGRRPGDGAARRGGRRP